MTKARLSLKVNNQFHSDLAVVVVAVVAVAAAEVAVVASKR
jgi:hypothetical protein